MQVDTVNLEVLRNELESARVERDLLHAAMLLDTASAARFRGRALALADSVPAMLRQHTREQPAFRVKLEKLADALRELSQLLRELPGTIHSAPLDNALARLGMLQQLPVATGDELLPIIPLIDTALSGLRRVCQSLPAQSQSPVEPAVTTQSTAVRLERALQQLTARLSREFRKELKLEVRGLKRVPADWHASLYEVCAELLGNAAEHGIETAAGRVAAGKERTALLQLHINPRPDGLELSMRDDGRGLDVPGIFRSAVAVGMWPEGDAGRDPREAARLIFKPGVTTASEAGRGNGMRRVLTLLKGLGARIRVSSERGSHLRLCADLPNPVSVEAPRSLTHA